MSLTPHIDYVIEFCSKNPNYVIGNINEEEDRADLIYSPSIKELRLMMGYFHSLGRPDHMDYEVFFQLQLQKKDFTKVPSLFKLLVLTHPTRGLISRLHRVKLSQEEDPKNCLQDAIDTANKIKELLEIECTQENSKSTWNKFSWNEWAKLSHAVKTLGLRLITTVNYGGAQPLHYKLGSTVSAFDAIMASKINVHARSEIMPNPWALFEFVRRIPFFLTDEELEITEGEKIDYNYGRWPDDFEVENRINFVRQARYRMHDDQLSNLFSSIMNVAPSLSQEVQEMEDPRLFYKKLQEAKKKYA